MVRNSLASRLVVGAAIWCALLLSVGGYGLAAVFADFVESSFDARLEVLLEGIVAGTEIDEEGKLTLRLQLGEPRFDQPFSGWYWQINDKDQAIRRSASLWVQTIDIGKPPPASGVTFEAKGPGDGALRVLVRPILLPGRSEPYWFVVAGDQNEVSQPTQHFNRLLAVSLGILFLGLLAAILIQVRFGLEPLRRIRRALAAIRSGQSRRLEGEYPSELQPLARELNALIGHSETLIERAQTHVGNLAHGLKTPLSVLANEARRTNGALSALVERQTNLMRQQVDHHLSRARAAATGSILGARTEVRPVLEDLRRALSRIYIERHLEIELECAPGLAFRGARQDIEEMLGNLMDNACKWAKTKVLASVRQDKDELIFTIEDDGEGLPESRREQVLERGLRLDETVPGSGLGLSIVVDLAALYAGRLQLGEAGLGGLGATLLLPAAASLPATVPSERGTKNVNETLTSGSEKVQAGATKVGHG